MLVNLESKIPVTWMELPIVKLLHKSHKSPLGCALQSTVAFYLHKVLG